MSSIRQLKSLCEGLNGKCGGVVRARGAAAGGTQTRGAQAPAAGANSEAEQCLADRANHLKNAKDIAKDCERELKSCRSFTEAKNAHDMCKGLARDAEQKERQTRQAADETKKNGDQAKDNEKKGESAGGMPQMPQIPQQQGGEETPPQQQADYPQNNNPSTLSENKPPEIETAKLDEDKDKTAVPAVGFGNTTPTDTATVTAPGGSFNAQGIDPNLRGLASNNLGDQPQGGTTAASVPAPGGGGGGGLNSSGSSSPGPGSGGDQAKGPNEANPYEIPVGSGGRLGAPKGKTGGESDTALDSAATSAFKEEFGATGDGTGQGEMAAGSEEDPGYTIFKMVRYRYVELKKKGNI